MRQLKKEEQSITEKDGYDSPGLKIPLIERLQHELSTFPVKIIENDGSVIVRRELNSYFLQNDKWSAEFLGAIPQFRGQVKSLKTGTKNISFRFTDPSVNSEVKYVFFSKLFNEQISLNTILERDNAPLKRISEFINKKYPTLHSLLDLNIDKVEREWLFWLEEQGIPTVYTRRRVGRKEYTEKSRIAYLLRFIHSELSALTDTRVEWDKNCWDVRILHSNYGITFNLSRSDYFLDFEKIANTNIRQTMKKYIKQRLLSKNFSWATARLYFDFLMNFFSLIFFYEPTWNDLKKLNRSHIEQYIEWLNQKVNKSKRKNSHPEHYINKALKILNKFISDMQLYQYDIAPEIPVRILLFPEDRPKERKKSIDQIDFTPDFVLEQLFIHINELHQDVIPVVWVAYKTGLRISDVLGLTWDCLECLNGKYSIVTDIEKTYVKGHRVPIDDELANMLAVLIHQARDNSNIDNNPKGFIFIRYHGSRKGKPYHQTWIQQQLNALAHEKKIVKETGEIFHFKMHQFRHTYAVKMLNGGADILTVKELLAHASPEMTLRYAKLLDNNKRKAFESVISQGVFSFDLNGSVQEIKAGQDIPEDILQTLWQDHKLNAMDNTYGTCHARLKGDCPYMEAPPCLTCGSGGVPCKDLAIGFSDLDVEKYMMHVRTTERAIEVSKQYGREDMVDKQQRNLERYRGILNSIKEGNVIFGRLDRIKRKQGVQYV